MRSLKFVWLCLAVWTVLGVGAATSAPAGNERAPIRILFLGDKGHHRPADRFQQLAPPLAARGIKLTYTEDTKDLRREVLDQYDGLLVYANIESITLEQEQALLEYVASGHGFIPLHCASFCFLNSDKYVELVGAQFQRHGTGVFRTVIVERDHPIMRGFPGFESWDETYVHHRHNEKDRTVLEYREGPEGSSEPWTWVRTHKKGRVFYTAWGHDERTWGHEGFQSLVERGIRWAVGQDELGTAEYIDAPKITAAREDVAPFEYVEANVPFYPAGKQWGTIGEPERQMQKPLSPEESIKHFRVPEGFEVQLFAAEPDIAKPICMNWDERGRLWIAETVDYPNELQPPGQGHDRIKICEDTDGDGKADKFTIFADNLSIPTSLAVVKQGVIVHQAPETLLLRDTNGDDQCDQREVLLSGWLTGDTHAGPSNLHYGLDNWMHCIVGYSGFQGEVGGQSQSFRTGFVRFKPDGSAIEFLRNTSNNSWGVGFTEQGLLFGSTANGAPSVYMSIPNRYYEQVRGWSSTVLPSIAFSNQFHPTTDRVRQVDHHGGFTAAAGHAFYTARTYPQEYWNRVALVAEPTGHLVAAFVIQPAQGADFRARYGWNLLSSDDEWSSPIMAEVGPDGHVWVIDWYNYIVQHNPTPAGFETGKGNAYVTDLRDKTHGRVYRVVHTAAQKADPIDLTQAAPGELVKFLSHENLLWRRHAQRLLVEGQFNQTIPDLIRLVNNRNVPTAGEDLAAIHALWTLHGLKALDGSNAQAVDAARKALSHPSAGVRRNAIMVSPDDRTTITALTKAGLLFDKDPHVRLEALLKLSSGPVDDEAAQSLVAAISRGENRDDLILLDGLIAASAMHASAVIQQLAANEKAIESGPALAGLLEKMGEHVARSAQAEESLRVVQALTRLPPAAAEGVLTGIARGWPKEGELTLDDATDQKLLELLPKLSIAGQSQIVALGVKWKSKSLSAEAARVAKKFGEILSDANQSDQERIAAAERLIEFQSSDAASAELILGAITPQVSSELAAGLVSALAKSQADETPGLIVENLSRLTPAVRPAAIRVLLGRTDAVLVLLQALDQGDVVVADLSLDQRQALVAHPNREISARAKEIFARNGSLPSADRQKVIAQLEPITAGQGDPKRGKEIFKKQCTKCHVHRGEGTKIGPDLTGMAVHPKRELLTQILDPSRNVEGNYRVYSAVLTDGRTINGLLAAETKTAIELIDSEAKRHVVLREDVEELVASQKSLMPEGFEKQVTAAELVDLLEFLTQRGRFLPVPLEKFATVTSVKGMFYSEQADVERLIFDDWSPKTVEGVPFQLVDPQSGKINNAILLHGPEGEISKRMPKSVRLPCNSAARAIHFLGGVSGWGYPYGEKGTLSAIVRLHYDGGRSEDHELKNGEQFADYIRRVDVPGSKFAFELRGQQLRYFSILPKSQDVIQEIELVKGPDRTAPVFMAVTVETNAADGEKTEGSQ